MVDLVRTESLTLNRLLAGSSTSVCPYPTRFRFYKSLALIQRVDWPRSIRGSIPEGRLNAGCPSPPPSIPGGGSQNVRYPLTSGSRRETRLSWNHEKHMKYKASSMQRLFMYTNYNINQCSTVGRAARQRVTAPAVENATTLIYSFKGLKHIP